MSILICMYYYISLFIGCHYWMPPTFVEILESGVGEVTTKAYLWEVLVMDSVLQYATIVLKDYWNTNIIGDTAVELNQFQVQLLSNLLQSKTKSNMLILLRGMVSF